MKFNLLFSLGLTKLYFTSGTHPISIVTIAKNFLLDKIFRFIRSVPQTPEIIK